MKKVLLLADINSTHTQKWAIGIIESGWKVFIFGLHAIKNDWYSEHGIEVKSFGLDSEVAGGSIFGKLKYFKAKNEVRDFVDQINPDIVHAHYATSYGMLGKLTKRRPLVVSVWGSEIYDFPQKSVAHKMFFKWIVKSPDAVCSTSQDMAKVCQTFVNRPIEIIPFGIDTSYFKTDKMLNENEVLTFGTVKGLEPVYGIDRLLKAYATYTKKTDQDSQLFIYGRGSSEEELKKLAIDLNIDKQTYFKGFVSGKELIKAYESLDVYCALSVRESFGVAILEAESMGIPVIVSNAGGLKEVVKDSQTGYIIKDGSEVIAADAMVILSDLSKRIEMGTNARQFVIDNFDFKKNLRDQIKIYDELIAKNK